MLEARESCGGGTIPQTRLGAALSRSQIITDTVLARYIMKVKRDRMAVATTLIEAMVALAVLAIAAL